VTVHIVGYEAGNIGSVVRAFRRVGVEAKVAGDPLELRGASHLLLPGVGAFASAMAVLERDGWAEALGEHSAAGRPLLGICLGMQLLASHGREGGAREGLGLVAGRVEHLEALGCPLRIPHVGWNEVRQERDSELLEGIPDDADFYFAHSFAFVADSGHDVLGWVDHGIRLVGMVQNGMTFGIQCHPEKSSVHGLRILANFAGI
jgi:glutamine amidotransferase